MRTEPRSRPQASLSLTPTILEADWSPIVKSCRSLDLDQAAAFMRKHVQRPANQKNNFMGRELSRIQTRVDIVLESGPP
jgi:hypothetical protein